MFDSNIYSSSYWLLGDDQLQMSYDQSREDSFRAHLKHSLLFNPSLLFSDSMAINNRNFRHIVEYDEDFRDLLTHSDFAIAVREDEFGKMNSLLELRNVFRADGKSRVVELDNSDEGLTFLQDNANLISYSGKQLAEYYSANVVDVFLHESVQERLPNGLWKDVHELATVAREELGNKFGRDFFFYKLKDRLIARRKGANSLAEINKHLNSIKSISEYHYITALPSSLDHMTPIYAKKHAEAFKICRGRASLSSIDGRPDIRPLRLLTSLASYEKCIAELSARDILELRATYEARAYYMSKFDFDVNKFEDSKTNLYAALAGYVRRIDERIIEKFGTHHKNDERLNLQFELKARSRGVGKAIDQLPDANVYVSVGAELMKAGISSLWSLLFVLPMINSAKAMVRAALNNAYVNPNLPDQKAEESLHQLKIEELQDIGGSKMQARLIFSKTRANSAPDETIYTGDAAS